MSDYKIKAMTAPQGARLFITTDFKTLTEILKAIRSGPDYTKGATLASVLQSITEANGNV